MVPLMVLKGRGRARKTNMLQLRNRAVSGGLLKGRLRPGVASDSKLQDTQAIPHEEIAPNHEG